MHILSPVVPSLIIMILTLLAALPWGIGSEHRFLLPYLVYAAIHYWTLRHPQMVPELTVFLSGLTLDVLTGGPLGYWSFVFLAGYAIAALQEPLSDGGRGMRWVLTLVALVCVALLSWALASLYYLEPADWHPIALGAASIGVGYPVLALILHMFDAPAGTRVRHVLGTRG